MQLIIAEKPSVARDLARVLGVSARGKTHFEGVDRVISWCVGHLVELDEPAAYDPRWKAWRLDTLPIIPDAFKLRPSTGAPQQFRTVRSLLRDRRFHEVINACDAGREGELIFRYIYQLAAARISVKRLWISSLTDDAIRRGFQSLRSGAQFDALADAARCRSEADWLVGMNATRAVTVGQSTGRSKSILYSIGRVQTPTLAMLVERERAIANFVPVAYCEVRGRFEADSRENFHARWERQGRPRLANEDIAKQITSRCQQHAERAHPDGPRVSSVKNRVVREPPPQLFDLTSLQRTANKRFGLSAARVLEIAQSLYERHKVLTYPRTDSRYLSKDLVPQMPSLFRTLGEVRDYAPFVRALPDHTSRISPRVFDDTKVSDHHAIIPTGAPIRLDALNRDEQRVFDMVARRFLGVFFPDAEFAQTEFEVLVGPGKIEAINSSKSDKKDLVWTELPAFPDAFVARGRVRLVAGWQEVAGIDVAQSRSGDDSEASQSLPKLKEGDRLNGSFEFATKQTKPPPRFNDATLLGAMESAGQQIEDEQLRAAMKERGLGTPATRAAIIETLLKRGYVARESKNLVATQLGGTLIDALPLKSLASPELTGHWEERLVRIARGAEPRDEFMRDIVRLVHEFVDASRAMPRQTVSEKPSKSTKPRKVRPKMAKSAPPEISQLVCPRCKQGTLIAGNRGWGCSRWREGCKFVVWFEVEGERITVAQLSVLVTKGKSRKRTWPFGTGRLILDPSRDGGAVTFERVK